MRKLLVTPIVLLLLVAACSSGSAESETVTESPVARSSPTAVPVPTLNAGEGPAPTPLVIPTPTAPESGDDDTPTPTAAPSPQATATPAPTAIPSATPRAIPTAIVVSPTPRPILPTATPVPPRPTPTPTAGWVNPDCYVGPGAADEPVWWCGGKICVVGALHHGCPTTPPNQQYVRVGCRISDQDIVVNEVITLQAWQDPVNVPVSFVFAHGDGTLDRTDESQAYYRHAGSYNVVMSWEYGKSRGDIFCGTVKVRANGSPTPTPVPGVQISCTITPSTQVQVNESLRFTAVQSPANVAVNYVFDHGDGTLDPTKTSLAYYAAPGFYTVTLRWNHAGGNGETTCGTVTVTPAFNTSAYLGKSANAAKAIATTNGFSSRVTRIDDQHFPVTLDYRLDRLNFEIDNALVTVVTIG